ncbi:MAG: hypothetical protein JWL67_931 [Solirubrobacterales bacterium]|nr:hypothetical protein [Solirubrobacterales bacterium]
MRSHVRVPLLALISCVLVAVLVPAAAQAAEVPAIEKFVATNCEVEKCGQENVLGPFNEPKAAVSVEEAEKEGYTQAGGRVPFGITDFKVLTIGSYPEKIPTSIVTHLRTDVAAGLATNPFAVTQCSVANFGDKEAVPGSGFYAAPKCAGSELGKNEATVYAGPEAKDVPLSGTVYNLEPEKGLASEFGVALKIPIALSGGALKKGFKEAEEKGAKPGEGGFPSLAEQTFIEEQQFFGHTLIKGNVEWGRQANGKNVGDYHDYFEIDVSPHLPLIRSRLTFEGRNGNGDFLTNATSCPGHNTTTLKMTDAEGVTVPKEFTTPIGLSGCSSLLFEPTFALTPATTLTDQPDPFTAAASESHNPKANDQSQVKSASFTLPEGMTLNPSAAHGLEACTPKQAHQEGTVFGPQFGVECPAGSKIGTVSLDVPTLPNGSLTGSVYLGGPPSGPITGPPYIIYVVANSEQFGVSVRLIGEVVPNETTGQVTTFFRSPPEQPFSKLALQFERGVLAPVANPLVCGTPTGSTSFEPTSAPGTAKTAAFGVPVTGCAATIPFTLTQSTQNQTTTAGGKTSYTFNLSRGDGQQYLSKVSTVLPEGIVGAIPLVTQCAEAQANAGTCGSASQIGTANVSAGSGPTPFSFSGPVYLTGPYQGAPFGLSIAVPAVAGPFNLGTVVTRATISVDPKSARVIATSTLPTIVKGVPLRLKAISVAVNKQGFLFNPTSCAMLSTDSTLTSTLNASQLVSTPMQLNNCGALAFKPSFKAKTGAKTSKKLGASLETTLNLPAGGSNVKSVLVTLPVSLPSRLTTLQKACPELTFKANPYGCPSGSFVGGVRANTPTLPAKMKGPAILVSHGGAAFPDLDLVLEGNGVRVILEGNTDIKKGITTTNFAATPDVPVSSITVNLPVGPHSALATFRNLCNIPLVMPTVITGQSGKVVKQKTKITVSGCGVQVVGHKVIGNAAFITVKTFAAGRISGSGPGLATVFRRLGGAVNATRLRVPLRRGAHGPRKVRLRVGFVPKNRKVGTSAAYVTVFFR